MSKLSHLLFSIFISVFFMGCQSTGMFTGTSSQMTSGSVSQPVATQGLTSAWVNYNGPKVRVSVMAFDNKTGQTTTIGVHGGQTVIETDPLGKGMADQMVTALMQTNAFTVIERQNIIDVQAEQTLTGSQPSTLAVPDYFIYGAVTEFQASQSNTGLGLGFDAIGGAGSGGAGWLAVAGKALSAMSKSDHVAIDIRIVNSRTGEIVAATSVEGKAKDFSGSMGGMFGSTLIGVSGEYRTPTAKAVRACIINAVNWVGDQMVVRQELERQIANN